MNHYLSRTDVGKYQPGVLQTNRAPLRGPNLFGAGNQVRTGDLNLGKVENPE